MVDLCVLTRKFNTVNFCVFNTVALCFFFKHGLVINPTQSSLTSFIISNIDVSLIKDKEIRLRAYLICQQKAVEHYAVTLQLSNTCSFPSPATSSVRCLSMIWSIGPLSQKLHCPYLHA